MYEFSRPMGDTIKKARNELGLTQAKVADHIDIDSRTVMNIENYNANPKMTVLFPLVRELRVDPWTFFYPELEQKSPAFRQLQLLLMECSDAEIDALLPICRAALSVLKSEDSTTIK